MSLNPNRHSLKKNVYRYWKHVLILTFLIIILICFKLLTEHKQRFKELKPPGIVLRQVGGLGNQLFRYACSYTLSIKLDIPLYIEVPTLLDPQNKIFYNTDKRPFILHKFNISLKNGINSYTWYSKANAHSFSDEALFEDLSKLPKDKLLVHNDFCQSETFFKDYREDIKQLFIQKIDISNRPIVQGWAELITNAGKYSVAVHIRRGDYVGRVDDYWVTPISFYQKAIKMLSEKFPRENLTFFVFSDDINSIKKDLMNFTLPNNVNVHFVSDANGITSLEDFYLMTRCMHMICSNSTFSWWAAYLIHNLDKVIIAAQFHPKSLDLYSSGDVKEFKTKEMALWHPPEWIVVDPFI